MQGVRWFSLLFTLSLPAPDLAISSPYVFEEVAVHGDPAPGTSGEVYGAFRLGKTASSDFPFLSDLAPIGGPEQFALFHVSGGVTTLLRRIGDPAPASIGGTYSSFQTSAEASDGTIVFHAGVFYGGTSFGQGTFKYGPGGDEVVALRFDPAPGTGGGTLGACQGLDVNASGDVLLRCHVADGSSSAGVFLASGGILEAVMVTGDPSPQNGTITSVALLAIELNDAGQIALHAEDTLGEMVVRISGGSTTVLAYEGDTAPESGGAFFTDGGEFAQVFSNVSLRESGAVVFVGILDDCHIPRSPPENDEYYPCAVYEYRGGAVHKIVRSGDSVAPVGGTYDRIREAYSVGATAVLFENGATVQWIASNGVFTELLDDEARQSISYPFAFINGLVSNADGQIEVILWPNIGGTPLWTIFSATPPPTAVVPVLAIPGSVILIIGLAVLCALKIRGSGAKPCCVSGHSGARPLR